MDVHLCDSCLVSESLCAGCQQKKDDGRLSGEDVAVARFIRGHSNEYNLSSASFKKAVDAGCGVVLIFTDFAAPLIGRKGVVVRALSKEFGKRVKIVQASADPHSMLSEILVPAELNGINEVFKAGGRTYRLRVPKRDAQKMPLQPSELAKVAKEILGAEVTVVFE